MFYRSTIPAVLMETIPVSFLKSVLMRIYLNSTSTLIGILFLLVNGGEKVSWFKQNSSRGGLDLEVNKHGWAGWQGNKISSKETTRWTLNREVNKKAA